MKHNVKDLWDAVKQISICFQAREEKSQVILKRK